MIITLSIGVLLLLLMLQQWDQTMHYGMYTQAAVSMINHIWRSFG